MKDISKYVSIKMADQVCPIMTKCIEILVVNKVDGYQIAGRNTGVFKRIYRQLLHSSHITNRYKIMRLGSVNINVR